MVKIAICGKMASGKTTIAEMLVSECFQSGEFGRFSLADAVKRFARFMFDIPDGHKDRVAFQKMRDGARRFLYEDVWIDTLLKEVAHYEVVANNGGLIKNFVVDDVRYLNEVIKLKDAGWITVKIDISEELQIERLKRTYPDDWETHVNARHHASEAEVDTIPDQLFDIVVAADDTDEPFKILESFISQ